MMDIIKQVRQTIQGYDMLARKDRVIVGVSGGPDSVSLIYILNGLKKELDILLYVAHLNHTLRGQESDKDMEFAIDLAKKLELPISTDCIDVASCAKKEQLSLEECARDVRYNFFVRIAEKVNANKIAVGHTKDDQSETVLMRLLRGSGAQGLCGIPPVRKTDGLYIIRPLIEVWKKDIAVYLKDNKITARQDSSNESMDYFRNRVRHHLLPVIKEYNPNIKETLSNMAENLCDDFEYINIMAKNKFISCAVKNRCGKITIDIKKLSKYHTAIQKQVLRLAISEIEGSLNGVEFRHWKELEDLIINRPPNSIVDLSKLTAAQKREEHLIIYRK